jgi:hypothetical protein
MRHERHPSTGSQARDEAAASRDLPDAPATASTLEEALRIFLDDRLAEIVVEIGGAR